MDAASHAPDKLSLFDGLSPAEQEQFRRTGKKRQYKKGDTIYLHGDKAKYFFIVTHGAIRLHRETPEGKEVTLHIAIVGDTMGDHELFESKSNYQASATASEPSQLYEFPLGWMRDQLREHPTLALNMLAYLSRNGRTSDRDKEHLFTLKTPQRVGCFLMQLCALHQFNPARFTLPYSKSTIASKLGMEPESFSRALSKLKEIGVSITGNNVSISDMHRLDSFVCGSCSLSQDCETCEKLHSHT